MLPLFYLGLIRPTSHCPSGAQWKRLGTAFFVVVGLSSFDFRKEFIESGEHIPGIAVIKLDTFAMSQCDE